MPKLNQSENSVFDKVDKAILQILRIAPSTTDTELGRQFGLNRMTISHRRNRPEFKAALDKLIEDQGKSALELFMDAVPDAVRVLKSIAKDKSAPASARVAAAHAFIDKTFPDKLNITGTLSIEVAQRTIIQIVEIIKQYVPDSKTREKIAEELKKVAV